MKKTALRPYPEPYADYGKSLVSQQRSDPNVAGMTGAATGGLLGAAAGGLVGRAITEDPKLVLLTALLGGLLGGGAGFYGGRGDRESQNTRLLALRRAGVDNPAELDIMTRTPLLSYRLTDKGYKV